MRVTSVAREKIAARLDRLQQMEGANRAARAESLIAFARDHDCGAVVTFDNPRRRDADDAAVPVFSVDNNAVGIAQRRIAGEALVHRAQNSPLFFLTVGIEMVEFGGQFAGAGLV